MFAIAWRYLTGRCVASDFASRNMAEWPPHPDRVFQAMVAAWGERGEDAEERSALEWLESLEPPALIVPEPQCIPDPVTAYVPVNDVEASRRESQSGEYGKTLGQILPAMRPKQERSFPSVIVGDSICALVWENDMPKTRKPTLERLCAAVGRIGHSSSLVHCWIADQAPPPTHRPSRNGGRKDMTLRVMERGRFSQLITHHRACMEAGRYSGPPLARQLPYVSIRQETGVFHGSFAAPLLVFMQQKGKIFTVHQALELALAFRALLIPKAESIGEGARELVSGHAANGSPLHRNHVAFLPMADVGHEYADGHLLGMAIAYPRDLRPDEEDGIMKAVALSMDDKGELQLNLGRMGEMRLRLEDGSVTPQALRSSTWCRESAAWATVTPVVLDRMSKAGSKDRDAWAVEQVGATCVRQGLPLPIRIEVSPVPYIEGSLPCYRKSLKGTERSAATDAAVFFPPLIRHNGQSNWMLHARLVFPAPVFGPLVLGAGRYRGYGLLKPIFMSPRMEGPC